jgi:Protein of unknown function (DUF2924)
MNHRSCATDQKGLCEELAALCGDTVKSLRVRWRALWNSEPPKRISRELLIRAIAYRLQERTFGGLKPSTLRLLERVGKDGSSNESSQTSRTRATPGTVLVREWQGTSYRVTVLDDGAVYRDRHYRSLSEVACAITGARWSGPLFFGLRRPGSEAASD